MSQLLDRQALPLLGVEQERARLAGGARRIGDDLAVDDLARVRHATFTAGPAFATGVDGRRAPNESSRSSKNRPAHVEHRCALLREKRVGSAAARASARFDIAISHEGPALDG